VCCITERSDHRCSVCIIRIIRLGKKFTNFNEFYNGHERIEQLWVRCTLNLTVCETCHTFLSATHWLSKPVSSYSAVDEISRQQPRYSDIWTSYHSQTFHLRLLRFSHKNKHVLHVNLTHELVDSDRNVKLLLHTFVTVVASNYQAVAADGKWKIEQSHEKSTNADVCHADYRWDVKDMLMQQYIASTWRAIST